MPFDASDPPPPRGVLAWTVRVAAVVGLASLGFAHYVAGAFDTGPGRGIERIARAPVPDPETTGSIAQASRRVVLDPCAMPSRAVAQDR